MLLRGFSTIQKGRIRQNILSGNQNDPCYSTEAILRTAERRRRKERSRLVVIMS